MRSLLQPIPRLVALCAVAAALTHARPASAKGSVSLDAATFTNGDAVYLSALLEGRVGLGVGALRVQLPLAWTSAGGEGAAIGAPSIGYAVQISPTAILTPTVTFPVRAFDDSGAPDEAHRALVVGRAMNAQRDLWLQRPEHVTIALPMSSVSQLGPLIVRQELAVALMLPAAGRGEDIEAAVQGAASLGLPFAERFVAALGLSAAWIIEENVQFALEPSLSARLGPTTQLGVALTMNLDHPAGFAFAEGGVWAIRVALVQVIP